MANRKHWMFLAALLFVVLCSLLATTISDMLVDSYVTRDVPFKDLQFIQSMFNYVEAFAVLLWGFIVDRFPLKRKLIVIINAATWITSGIILFVVPTVTSALLFGINVAWGISIGANGAIIASYLGDLFHIAKRGRLFAVFTIALYVIKSSTIAVNGIIGEAMSSWTLPLGIFSFLGIIAMLIFWRLAPEPRFGSAEPEFAETKYAYHFHPGELKAILRKKTNLLFVIQGFTGMAGVAIVTKYMLFWFTYHTSDGLGLPSILTTVILGIGGAFGALIGIILAGYLADWAYKRGKINQVLFLAIACLFLQVAAYAVVILVPTYPSALNLEDIKNITDLPLLYSTYPIFLTFILGFNIATFFSTPIGTTVGIVRTHVNLPEHRGTVSAIYDFSDFLGAGVGILVASSVFTAIGSYRVMVVFGSLFWIISGIIWIVANFTIKKDFSAVRQVLQDRSHEEHSPGMKK